MNKLKGTGAGIVLWLMAAPAFAVICESTGDNRYMTLTPDSGTAVCKHSGTTRGKDGQPEGQFHADLGFNKIDKLDDDDDSGGRGIYMTVAGLGGASGSITFVQSIYDLYEAIYVTFKYGNGQAGPDWFTYNVVDVQATDWSVAPASQDLSHVTLYGGGDYTEVPAPAPLALLGLGLIMVTRLARRRA